MARSMAFEIGDAVRCILHYDGNDRIVGKVGEVVCFDYNTSGGFSGRYGIAFEENIHGHSLSGRCMNGHGFFIEPYALEPHTGLCFEISSSNLLSIINS